MQYFEQKFSKIFWGATTRSRILPCPSPCFLTPPNIIDYPSQLAGVKHKLLRYILNLNWSMNG